jgi:predicted DNA-binding WGR domain protein
MPRYEFVEGSSSKFWEITLEGTSFTTTYGRIGTDGQTSMKEYDSEEKAKKEYDKLVAEKTKKGYTLVGGGGAAAAPPKPAAPPPSPPKPEAKPVAAKPTKPSFDDEGDDEDVAPAKAAPAKPTPIKPAAVAVPSASSTAARRFEFVEGSSSKFWEIQVEGSSFTTRYGKIGTDGQQSLKEYDSPAKAQAEAEKLIGEKTKKGYVEK